MHFKISCKRIKKLIIFLLSTVNFALADTAPPVYPSAWAWKISSPTRTLYLFGELHDFSGLPGLKIDHALGKKAYELSESVYQEPKQAKPENKSVLLSDQVSKDTWNRVKAESKKIFFSISKKSESEINVLHEKSLSELQLVDPVTAYAQLSFLTNLKFKKQNFRLQSYQGLSALLRDLDKRNNMRKLMMIEENTALDTAWRKNCTSPEKAEILLQEGIKNMISNRAFEDTEMMQTQAIFFRDDEAALEKMASSSPFNVVLTDCAVTPRNLNWLPKLTNLLETRGDPVSVVVGVGHVVGEKGLLALLKTKGYTDIKRIYEISP